MKRLCTMLALAAVGLTALEAAAEQAEKLYSIEAKAGAAVASGAAGEASIQIKTKGEAYIHAEAPFKVALDAKNLKLDKDKLDRGDAIQQQDGPLLKIPFTAGAAGPAELNAEMTFFICTKTLCERQKKTVIIPIEIK
ncbi:MAG TPA: hypothetical protein DFS52_29375 [Myxococcales bacterium]|nr:hypothetical protein [Myxococcales bacterium]